MKFWYCPGVGIYTLFLNLCVGFLNEPPSPTLGHLQLFQTKMTNARQMPEWAGMGTLGIDWAIASTQDDIENRRLFFFFTPAFKSKLVFSHDPRKPRGRYCRDDTMFVVKVFCKIETSPWARTLTESVPEAFESRPASDWPEIFFLANQRREAAGWLSCFFTRRSFPHRSP